MAEEVDWNIEGTLWRHTGQAAWSEALRHGPLWLLVKHALEHDGDLRHLDILLDRETDANLGWETIEALSKRPDRPEWDRP